jgi:trehalose-6-phosphatase
VRRNSDSLEACPQGAGLGRAALGLLAGFKPALPIYVGAGEADEEGFHAVHRIGGLTVHVGAPPRQGTNARYHVADCGEVIRLIHWLADARRRVQQL